MGRNARVGHGRSWLASPWAAGTLRPVRELGVPKAWAWPGVTTRLALRSQQAGARGRAPQARSAAPNEHKTPPVTGTFIQSAPKQHKTPSVIGTLRRFA